MLLVAEHGAALHSDVLIAPHHGSRTSSTAPFLDAVHPKIAVFQAGYRNRFGHLAPDVLERYRERGIVIVASPACGACVRARDGRAPTGTRQATAEAAPRCGRGRRMNCRIGPFRRRIATKLAG
ncbi:MAG TPA: hypothetical protein VNS61_10030 [Caldimonas sp.]|nr:hypothetical protein [Caldimonas sp.]